MLLAILISNLKIPSNIIHNLMKNFKISPSPILPFLFHLLKKVGPKKFHFTTQQTQIIV